MAFSLIRNDSLLLNYRIRKYYFTQSFNTIPNTD